MRVHSCVDIIPIHIGLEIRIAAVFLKGGGPESHVTAAVPVDEAHRPVETPSQTAGQPL
jgi:hypothetical protein